VNGSFFGDLLQTIADRGRALVERRDRRASSEQRSANLVELCEALLSGRGEASGVALAREILHCYAELKSGARIAFFESLATGFGPDHGRLDAAVDAWRSNPSDATAAVVHLAAEPRRQELLRRLNLAPGGTAALVRMREQLLDAMEHRADLAILDRDFVHMFSSWFNRGFLVLRRIDWSTPASVLERIIRYEAVHQIHDWDDLRRRIDPPDRRCYAFFHPALIDDPLIFVEVALTRDIPGAIDPILAVHREALINGDATTAVFYSISNCQRGLTGVSFGNFLIKQVAEEVARDHPKLTRYVTLSPVPGFAEWLARTRAAADTKVIKADDAAALANLEVPGWWNDERLRALIKEPLLRAAAWYFLHAKTKSGTPVDPVARFHLGNGARLERLNWLADTSERGLAQSHGLMVNYLYELADIEENHEAYAQQRTVVASSAVTKLNRTPSFELASLLG
jgi:malonyl-CoA decarboxylase